MVSHSFLSWPAGELAQGSAFLRLYSLTFHIKVNEYRQGEQRVAAAVKDAVLCLASL